MSESEWIRLTPKNMAAEWGTWAEYRPVDHPQIRHALRNGGNVNAICAKGIEGQLFFSTAELAAIPIVKALAEAARRVNNTFYGMLLRDWGHPDDWPNAHGKVVYEELKAALAQWEADDGPSS